MSADGWQGGLLTASTDRCLVDAVAASGLSFLWLDAEHTSLDARHIEDAVRRITPSSVDVLVRVPRLDPDTLVTFANAGADEIVLPRVESAKQVRDAWDVLQFPPAGRRPRQVVGATEWGQSFTGSVRVSVILETRAAVADLPGLLELGVIESFWIGHKDLTDECIHAGLSLDQVDALRAEVVDKLRAAGVRFGWAVSDPDDRVSVADAGGCRWALYWDAFLPTYVRGLSVGAEMRG